MRYFVYCRKSTEAEDRQILSIDSQEAELRRAFFDRPEIEIIETCRESFSAKAPGRPIFNEMIERIERGEADGILAWHPDRLARNSIDGGRIIYLLDRKVLKDLKFATFSFENSSQGKLMLQVLLGFSKYYVDSLSENVKRGNRAKIALGWRPNMAPIGYLNEKNFRTIVPDHERFPLIRKLFDHALTGSYSLRALREESIRWGLRTPQRRRIGGKYISIAAIYRVLTNPFYAGLLVWNGEISRGAHQPMVTIEEFDRVRRLLARPGKPTPQKYTFPLTGMIRCGECGFMVTAEEKVNRYDKRYTYYHCTKRRLDYRCRQPWVPAPALDAMIREALDRLVLPPRMHQFFREQLEHARREQTNEALVVQRSVEHAINDATKALGNLTTLRVRDLISDDEFIRQRRAFQEELLRLKEEQGVARNPDQWFEPSALLISFSHRAADWYIHGDDRVKRLIVRAIGSNPTIKDKILSIEARKPFVWVPAVGSCSELRGGVEDVRSGENVPGRKEVRKMLYKLRTFHVERDAEFLETVHLVRQVTELMETREDEFRQNPSRTELTPQGEAGSTQAA